MGKRTARYTGDREEREEHAEGVAPGPAHPDRSIGCLGLTATALHLAAPNALLLLRRGLLAKRALGTSPPRPSRAQYPLPQPLLGSTSIGFLLRQHGSPGAWPFSRRAPEVWPVSWNSVGLSKASFKPWPFLPLFQPRTQLSVGHGMLTGSHMTEGTLPASSLVCSGVLAYGGLGLLSTEVGAGGGGGSLRACQRSGCETRQRRSASRNATCVASGMQQAVSKRVRCKN